MENVDAFVSAQETIERVAGDLGATAVRASQTILGGEAQGNVQVAFETETINSWAVFAAFCEKHALIKSFLFSLSFTQ